MIAYVIFGVLTTVINWLSYYALTRVFSLSVTWSGIIAWIISVLFAYITNRGYVFKSDARGVGAIARELAKFASGRVITGVIDIALVNLAVYLSINDAIAKAVINVLVIALNYVFSKLFVFRK